MKKTTNNHQQTYSSNFVPSQNSWLYGVSLFRMKMKSLNCTKIGSIEFLRFGLQLMGSNLFTQKCVIRQKCFESVLMLLRYTNTKHTVFGATVMGTAGRLGGTTWSLSSVHCGRVSIVSFSSSSGANGISFWAFSALVSVMSIYNFNCLLNSPKISAKRV